MKRKGETSSADPKLRTRIETVFERTTERVARVYAESVLRAAEPAKQTDDVVAQFEEIVYDLLPREPSLEAFLTSGIISRKDKKAFIEKIFGSRASELVVNTLQVLNAHDRLEVLRPMVAILRDERDRRNGLMRVIVRTAVPLKSEEAERLKERIRQRLGREPVLDAQLDPGILGGMTIQVGDVLYDHSVRAQLIKIRNQILARSSHEIQSGRDRFSTAS